MQRQTITTCFGPASFAAPEEWSAHAPLPGFPELRRFVLLDIALYRPFQWLHSIEDPQVCLGLAPPQSFGLKYPPIPDESLFGHAAPNAALLVMTTFTRDERAGGPPKPQPNASAPVCFDPDSMHLVQWILASKNAIRHTTNPQPHPGKAALPAIAVNTAG